MQIKVSDRLEYDRAIEYLKTVPCDDNKVQFYISAAIARLEKLRKKDEA